MPVDPITEADPAFDRLARVLQASLGTPLAMITVARGDRLLFPGAAGLPAPLSDVRTVPLDESMCQHVVADAAPLVVPDARLDDRLRELSAVRENGVTAYAGVPLRDAQNEIVGSVCVVDFEPRHWTPTQLGIIEDVAAAASAEFRLRSNAALLTRSYEQLTLFAGQISHDLKSPLGAILGFLDLTRDELTDPDDQRLRGYVDRCTSSARRMVRTIDELLAYATVGGALNIQKLSLDTVMQSVADDLGVDLEGVDLSWMDAPVTADPVQLRCLLQNIVGNAVKFRRREVSPVVAVRASSFPSHVELRVIDNGPGIPAARREEVLRPMVRLHRDVPGTGLGLATCDRIVTAHGGLIQLTGSPGGGTTVVIQLPHTDATTAAPAERLVAIA